MYKIRSTKSFDKRYRSLVLKDRVLEKKIIKTLKLLKLNPSYPSLWNHKAHTKNHGVKWSVSVDKKIRIIYDFDQNNSSSINLLDIGPHQIYK